MKWTSLIAKKWKNCELIKKKSLVGSFLLITFEEKQRRTSCCCCCCCCCFCCCCCCCCKHPCWRVRHIGRHEIQASFQKLKTKKGLNHFFSCSQLFSKISSTFLCNNGNVGFVVRRWETRARRTTCWAWRTGSPPATNKNFDTAFEQIFLKSYKIRSYGINVSAKDCVTFTR